MEIQEYDVIGLGLEVLILGLPQSKLIPKPSQSSFRRVVNEWNFYWVICVFNEQESTLR